MSSLIVLHTISFPFKANCSKKVLLTWFTAPNNIMESYGPCLGYPNSCSPLILIILSNSYSFRIFSYVLKRLSSSSKATTVPAIFDSIKVSYPKPAPISNTTSLFLISAACKILA